MFLPMPHDQWRKETVTELYSVGKGIKTNVVTVLFLPVLCNLFACQEYHLRAQVVSGATAG